MSESNEAKLLKSLIWSTKEFPLAEFVEKYQLPQVVCVEVGFFGDNESTTLSGGQVLTLHSLQQTTKVVCESPFDGVVVIPLHCPLKFRVLPKDCDHASVTAEQLSTVYRAIKYIRVVKGQRSKNNTEESLDVDDILMVRSLDTARGLIKCTNVASRQNVSIPLNCDALFSPLLDPGDHTLAEVKKRFGFPAKVYLSDKDRRGSSCCNDSSSMSVSSLGTLTVYDEIEDCVVISTTLCDTKHDKVCLRIPKDLQITVVVAEGFMSGDETYQRVVKTLDQSLNKTSLKDFENLDVYEHLDVVKNSAPCVSSTSVERGSARVEKLVMEHRSSQFTPGPSPKLPPRMPSKPSPPALDPSWAPIIPPKPSPKPPRNQPPTSGSTVVKRLKSLKALKSPWLPMNKNRNKSEGDEPEYVEASTKCSDIYEDTENYMALDQNYQSTDNIYQEPLAEAPQGRVKPPSIPPPPPPAPRSNKEQIYEAIARIPRDLSPLTTTEVGKALTYLGMECYVIKFANEMIDGEMLQSIDEESLESLDVNKFHIKKLLKFIRGWRPNV